MHVMVQGKLRAHSQETELDTFHAFLDHQEFAATSAIAAARATKNNDGQLQQGQGSSATRAMPATPAVPTTRIPY